MEQETTIESLNLSNMEKEIQKQNLEKRPVFEGCVPYKGNIHPMGAGNHCKINAC